MTEIPSERAIADAIGAFADRQISPDEPVEAITALIVSVLRGPVLTDRGLRLYYVELPTMALPNVDTSEGIWSTADDGLVRGGSNEVLADLRDDSSCLASDLFPLVVSSDRSRRLRWDAAMARASNERRRVWAKAKRRLIDRLGTVLV